MGAWDFSNLGNKPINSTGFAPVGAGSTSTLYAELDSTRLGTKDFIADQHRLFQVTWIVGADTNVTWQLETATDTALANGVDVIYAKTPTGQSAQYVTCHVLTKDMRIRARQASSGANGAAYISAVPL
jgi:hypothetical protein